MQEVKYKNVTSFIVLPPEMKTHCKGLFITPSQVGSEKKHTSCEVTYAFVYDTSHVMYSSTVVYWLKGGP